MNNRNLQRAIRCDAAITKYGDDLPESNLIDLLTDAMHWCPLNDQDFHTLLHMAMRHYVAELREPESEGGEP